MPPAKSTGAAKPGDGKDETPAVPTQSTPNHDETDVAAALKRKTADGPGDDPAPESDFHSFATEGVEKKDLKSVEDVTSEVLAGRWGATAKIAEERLDAAGYDVDAVAAEFKRRKEGGAPSAF